MNHGAHILNGPPEYALVSTPLIGGQRTPPFIRPCLYSALFRGRGGLRAEPKPPYLQIRPCVRRIGDKLGSTEYAPVLLCEERVWRIGDKLGPPEYAPVSTLRKESVEDRR